MVTIESGYSTSARVSGHQPASNHNGLCGLRGKMGMTNRTSCLLCDGLLYHPLFLRQQTSHVTGSSAQGGVPNSFVLPVHSCVPQILLHGIVVPWCNSLRLPALYLLNLHSCTPAPLNWRTLPGYRVSLSSCR